MSSKCIEKDEQAVGVRLSRCSATSRNKVEEMILLEL